MKHVILPKTIANVFVARRSRLSFLACIPFDLQLTALVRILEDVARLKPFLEFLPRFSASLPFNSEAELVKEPELSILIRDLKRFKCEGCLSCSGLVDASVKGNL